ncbi:hypothetical protein WMY93_003065 [Mugilogobius chulae]|uniref:Nucleoside diphosphate kinase B n=1 Tax=Mugilogobius chulae TaxID=88201 RepID=A0AAW0PYG3_9GOBI
MTNLACLKAKEISKILFICQGFQRPSVSALLPADQKPFYPDLVDYMTSGPVVAMVWEGPDIVKTSRMMVGHTNPAEAQAGTIRADFSFHVSRNVVHASDSAEGAQREIQLWFEGQDLLNWDCIDQSFTSEL